MTKDTTVDLIRDLTAADSTSNSKRVALSRGKVVGWVLTRGKDKVKVVLTKGRVEETALIRDRMEAVPLTKGHPLMI